MVCVARITLADIKSKRLRFFGIAADADHLFRTGMFQQVERGLNAENTVAAENDVGFHLTPPNPVSALETGFLPSRTRFPRQKPGCNDIPAKPRAVASSPSSPLVPSS